MKRAQERFVDRDDVIAFNKKEYGDKAKDYIAREKDNYLPAGVSDLKDMKRCMKYANSMLESSTGMTQEQADRKAAATLDFRKRLQDQGQTGAIYDKNKQEKYIKQMMAEAQKNGKDPAKTEIQYRNAFKSIVAFDAANA